MIATTRNFFRRWEWRRPWLTALTLSATLIGTCTRLFGTGVFHALRRDPSALGHWQLWRLVTPVLVQGDGSVLAIVEVFVLCAVIGVAAEQLLPRGEWIALYVVGVLAGHGIGEVFQPHQSGTSVAFAGVLGGIAAKVLLDRDPRHRLWRLRFGALIPLAILDTVLRDIHGLAFLAGLAVGLVFELRRARDPLRREQLERCSVARTHGREVAMVQRGFAQSLDDRHHPRVDESQLRVRT
jgi:rhomboid protease GluP